MRRSSRIGQIVLVCGVMAFALACEEQPMWVDIDASPNELFARVDTVFVGTVMSIEDQAQWFEWAKAKIGNEFDRTTFRFASKRRVMVEFEVTESLKGETKPRQVVRIPPDGATCGMNPQPGETYLVYALEVGEGTLYSNACLHTARTRQATPKVTTSL